MRRFDLIIIVLAGCPGCVRSAPDAPPPAPLEKATPVAPPKTEPAPKHEAAAEALWNRPPRKPVDLTLDPKTCPRGQAKSGWGLGSFEVIVLGRENNCCIFEFTQEVEGGYRVYRVRAPVEGPPIRVWEEGSGLRTSFKLSEAELLRQGNVFFDPPQRSITAQNWKQQTLPNTHFVNSIDDEFAGAGPVAQSGNRITIRYAVFADRDFSTFYVGIPRDYTLEFTLGENRVGQGLEAAVLGMQVGGKRRAIIREEVATQIAKDLGGVLPETQLTLEIELLQIE